MIFRHQLAAYSPIRAIGAPRGIAAALGLVADPRGALAGLLRSDYAADKVILCGSGTQALQIAIRIAVESVGANEVVAIPAFSCFDMATAAVGAGSRFALYDVDPKTLGPDLRSLERVLVAGARVVVAAPLYGVPIPWEPLAELAARHGAVLVEDAAQGHGARWNGHLLGTLGKISTLSFGRGKGWTGGNGGAVLLRGNASSARDVVLADASSARELKTTAGYLAQYALGRPAIYGAPRLIPGLELGVTRYHEPSPPSRMPRASAAFVLGNRDRSSREADFRRTNAEQMLAELTVCKELLAIEIGGGGEPGYLRLPIRVRGGSAKLRAFEALRRLGVERSYPAPLHELAATRPLLEKVEGSWPGADSLVRELVTIPTHSLLSAVDRSNIVELLCTAA